MEYVYAFLTGGTICALVQILLDRTRLMPGGSWCFWSAAARYWERAISTSLFRSWPEREPASLSLVSEIFCGTG